LVSTVVVVPVVLSLSVAVAQSYVTVSGHVMLYQKDSVPVPDGALNFCEIVESPLVGEVEPNIAANEPECGPELVTPAVPVEVQPDKVPVSNPPLMMPPLLAGLTVQLNEALPWAPVVSVAVTTALEVPGVVGVPVIKPLVPLMPRPAGSPVAL